MTEDGFNAKPIYELPTFDKMPLLFLFFIAIKRLPQTLQPVSEADFCGAICNLNDRISNSRAALFIERQNRFVYGEKKCRCGLKSRGFLYT